MRTAGPRAGRGAAGPAPTTGSPVPPGLARALEAQRAWGWRGVHLVPIRHHSPACALALSALLEEVRPAVVLIEAAFGARPVGAVAPCALLGVAWCALLALVARARLVRAVTAKGAVS